MKITIVQGAFLPVPPLLGGAVEKWWFQLGKEFAEQGHSVTHISRSFGSLPVHELVQGVCHIRVPGFSTSASVLWLKTLDLIYSLRVIRVLPQADILVTNTFWLPVVSRHTSSGLIYVHVARFPKGQMRFYGRAARLQAVSTVVGDAIIAQAPRMVSKVGVQPGLLSPEMFSNEGPKKELAHRICYVGRIHPEKGLELLLKAFAVVVERGLKNWKLRIIGPWEVAQGGGGPKFMMLLKQLASPCGECVEFLGPEFNQAALTRHFNESDLFVYPSLAALGEAFGSAPLESMAARCPPLVSGLACFRDYIRDGVNGFVFDHTGKNNASVLAEKLLELLQSPGCLSLVGERARTTAEQYSAQKVAGGYLADFEHLISVARSSGRLNPRN